MSVFGI